MGCHVESPLTRARHAIGGILFALLAECAHAVAQEPRAAIEATERSVQFGGLGPTAGFTASPSEGDVWRMVGFYVQAARAKGEAEVTLWWVARLVIMDGDRRQIRWADSRACPALVDALGRMMRISPAGFTVSGMQPYAPIPAYLADGVVYTVWSNSGVQPDGSPVDVTMTGNGGGLAEWGEATLRALEPCWSDDAPPRPRRS